MAQPEPAAGAWVPEDTFGARLALVRQKMHWNYEQAGALCGISSENWRQWEKGERRPQKMEAICHKIADASHCDYVWLIAGWASSADPKIGSSFTLIDTFGQLELALGSSAPQLCRV